MAILLHRRGDTSFLSEFLAAAEGIERGRGRGRSHDLTILSCYVEFRAVMRLVTEVHAVRRLKSVRLVFEQREAFRSRTPQSTKTEIATLKREMEALGVTLDARSVHGGLLVHAKGFALHWTGPDGKRSGVTAVGSVNATHQGMGSARTANIEMSSFTRSAAELSRFLGHVDDLVERNACPLDHLDEETFRYALLSSGVFLHQWTDTLAQRTIVRFPLTDAGIEAIKAPEEFQSLGVTAESSSVSLRPLKKLADFPSKPMIDGQFTRHYTVETGLGHWCPGQVWDAVERRARDRDSVKGLIEAFKAATADAGLGEAVAEAGRVGLALEDKGYVKDAGGLIERWRERVVEIRDDPEEYVLTLSMMRMEAMPFPIVQERRRDWKQVWAGMFERIDEKRRHFVLDKKLLDARRKSSLRPMRFNKEEIEDACGHVVG